MSSKPIYVTQPSLPPFEEYCSGLKKIWDSKILTNNGQIHREFEDGLKKYLGIDHISLFVNGHQALEIAIKALNLSGEIITTPFSFASTTHAIVRNGLRPVFADIRSTDFNLDETQIEGLITEKTSAILPVHVYGNPCNIDEIEKIAQRYHLKVIYDAAHAFGVKINGQSIANFGDISMFSFHATKVFTSIEGGSLAFKSPELVEPIGLLKNFGIKNAEEVILPGTNAKMNEFQSLMGLLNLKYVDQEISNRKKVVEKYRSLLEKVPGIRFVTETVGVKSNYAYFPILVEADYSLSRDQLFNLLASHNIFARKYFYPLITNYQCYQHLTQAPLPVANYVADRVISLPLWGSIPDSAIDEICEIIATKK